MQNLLILNKFSKKVDAANFFLSKNNKLMIVLNIS